MAERELRPDVPYYVGMEAEQRFLIGDLFNEVPLAYPVPPDAIAMREGKRVYLSGPFDAGHAMLVTPSCANARAA